MRSMFLKALCLSALLAGGGWALSLYDTAPSIGLPVSQAVKYTLTARVGYDDNINSTHSYKQRSIYTGANLGASYADYESSTKAHYNASLGATYYLKRAYSSNQKWFSDNRVSGGITHSFSERCTNNLQASLSYQPEPDYANGMSASRAQGDCFNWSLSDSITRSIDSRWNWSLNASYTGNFYSKKVYEYDDRQYIHGGVSLSVRTSELVSYSLKLSYRKDLKKSGYGYNSDNFYATLGTNRSLTPYSSMNVDIGVQQKQIRREKIWTPTVRAGYNRKVTEGFNLNFYISLDNENVDTYRGSVGSYLSDPTWRLGFNGSYAWSPDLSLTFGCSYYSSSYGRGEGNLQDYNSYSVNPTIGVNFRITDSLRGNLRYTYTVSNSTYSQGSGSKYYRNNVSFSTTYTF
ncbi:MAG: hypothetical protein MJ058_08860 [Akkermansia sp.]|nr:hypothetical protein [Akkermansia sp.]